MLDERAKAAFIGGGILCTRLQYDERHGYRAQNVIRLADDRTVAER
jgi:hypothetical protein